MNFYFDPAFWKYEGAQAKIVVYYPRNEVKSCGNSPLPNQEQNTTEFGVLWVLNTHKTDCAAMNAHA